MTYSSDYLRSLVREDRVHRKMYVDPEIFELEKEKIFKKVWMYVGHESLVPDPGDYYCTTLVGQEVVLSRSPDGNINVIFNRCGHRGARVLNRKRGNAKVFTCMYHGWGFKPDGTLAGVPMKADFPGGVLEERASGMVALPRVKSYRGFVFASFNADVEPLEDYLGEARRGIDELTDRSPVGKIEFAFGCHRYHFDGNWKLQLENQADMYHPAACHASTVGPDGRQFQRRAGKEGGDAAFFTANGEAVVAQTGVRGFLKGHSSEASLFDKEQSGGVWDEYRAMMVDAYGEERTRDILKNRRHSMTLFPSVDILIAQTSVRVIRAVAVDRTEIEIWPVRLVGAPDVISTDLVKYVNITHSASSFIQSDDLEAFERCQEGLKTEGAEWFLVAKGLGDEVDEGKGVLFGPRSSEVGQRAQHVAWRDLMGA
ncbi:aromatic ring-hydroxylating dioxygenase subunit alpha [Paraburkholderia sp. USG1]|uniref:aromatic ring-hydroxylating oxygenase subunit alpha n=1 Tax=Paraburkholderia sp. USG1 TaxID=2952268 RepID=UPI002857612E|nr:aromatic ring-hydroxylating dioxygenase subunit alpha [Paraburkholderia sp. USG1]MDR8395200.1 aromatic ring-hydroxylating dioxygenase subunit alpha [Paraburkholderia sp. USG1]